MKSRTFAIPGMSCATELGANAEMPYTAAPALAPAARMRGEAVFRKSVMTCVGVRSPMPG